MSFNRHRSWVFLALLAVAIMLAFSAAPANASTIYIVRGGDTLSGIAVRFHTTVRAIATANHITNVDLIRVGQRLVMGGSTSTTTPKPREPNPPATRDSLCGGPRGQLNVPVSPWVITQSYKGPYPNHSGIDLAGPGGVPVRSVVAGTVTRVHYWGYSYGHHVDVTSPCGVARYAHFDKIYVHLGQHVSQGQALGTRDSTGNSTGSHLHFELIIGGRFVNPAGYLWSYARGGPPPPEMGGFKGMDNEVTEEKIETRYANHLDIAPAQLPDLLKTILPPNKLAKVLPDLVPEKALHVHVHAGVPVPDTTNVIWEWLWLAWFAGFGIIEGFAFKNDMSGTLSAHFRKWFRVDTHIGRTAWIITSVAFMCWFIVHILS